MFLSVMTTATMCLVLGLVAGFGLLVQGLYGRRVGSEPRCRRCAYDLTGIESQRCPECASEFTSKCIRVGRRRRRRGLLATGLAVMILCGSGLGLRAYGRAKRIDWYRHYPEFALLGLAPRDDMRAVRELVRRIKAGQMRADACRCLVEIALDHHASKPVAIARDWADLLALFDNAGELSSAQRDQFYRQLAPMRLRIRPKIREGDWVVMQIDHEARGSQLLPLMVKYQIQRLRIEGHEDFDGDVFAKLWADLQPGNPIEWEPTRLSVSGRHTVECDIHQGIFDESVEAISTAPRWSQVLRLTGEVDVVPFDDPDPVKGVKNEALDARVQEAVHVSGAIRIRDATGDCLSPSVSIDAGIPCCLAFDVFAEIDGREIQIGTDGFEPAGKGRLGRWPVRDGNWLQQLPTSVTLRFTGSRDAAGLTLSCFEFWDGTLRFEDVRVHDLFYNPASGLGPVPTLATEKDSH